MKLYYHPKSRAAISKWLLDELGVPHELVNIDFEKQEHKQPDFLAINPAGKLPALVDGQSRVYESSAIALYLADKFSEVGLAPAPDSPERGRYLSLMVYATSQLEPAMGDMLMEVDTLPQRGWQPFEQVLDVIEGELGQGPYLFGHRFSAADIQIGAMLIWMRLWGKETGRPRLEAYVDRLMSRPHAMTMPS